jgi:hypothetical protein
MPTFSDQFAASVHAAERTIRILWAALMASVCMYGGVLFLVASNGEAPEPPAAALTYVFPVVALMSASTGAMLFRAMSSPDRVRALLQADRAPQDTAKAQGLPDAERRLSRIPPLYFTLYILRWALFESVAIFGLVLGILHHSFLHFVPFGLAALVLMAMTPPRITQQIDEAIALLPSS